MDHVTCLACGCLCDDIRVVVEGGRIIEAERACSIGRSWFLDYRLAGDDEASVFVDGHPSELEPAIDRAVEILKAARAPLVWGLTGSTIEAVASALKIADRIGAVVDLEAGPGSAGRLEAFQRVGQVSATLGEVKDRADVVVFWGVDPLVSHPRHWERYSVEPRGRFIPEGRAGRFVIVVGDQPSESSRRADLFVKIDRDRQAEALDLVRALVLRIPLDPDRACQSAGVPSRALEGLAQALQSARYGAMFFEPSQVGDCGQSRTMEALLKLVRDLNDGRRFVALEMGSPGNGTGAASALTWQAGAGSSVDFGPGYPRHLPREATLRSRIEAGEADALLLVAGDEWMGLGADLIAGLAVIPTILIGPGNEMPTSSPVRFRTARPGIETGGTVSRVDGVMLPLRPPLRSPLPGDREILDRIGRALDALI